jgi:hypothetical protein
MFALNKGNSFLKNNVYLNSMNTPWKYKVVEYEYSRKDSSDYISGLESSSEYRKLLESFVRKHKKKNTVMYYYNKLLVMTYRWFHYGFLNWAHPWFIIRHRYFYRGF